MAAVAATREEDEPGVTGVGQLGTLDAAKALHTDQRSDKNCFISTIEKRNMVTTHRSK